MRRGAVTLALSVVLAAGCGTPYMTDRGRDAADVLVLTAGLGIGGSARVGPIAHGFLQPMVDLAGVRGGVVFADFEDRTGGSSAHVPLVGFEKFPSELKTEAAKLVRARDKEVLFIHYGGLGLHEWSSSTQGDFESRGWRHYVASYTQVEAAGAALLGFRVGFNPGELVDFLVGWFGLDLYGDDIEQARSSPASGEENERPAEEEEDAAAERVPGSGPG